MIVGGGTISDLTTKAVYIMLFGLRGMVRRLYLLLLAFAIL